VELTYTKGRNGSWEKVDIGEWGQNARILWISFVDDPSVKFAHIYWHKCNKPVTQVYRNL